MAGVAKRQDFLRAPKGRMLWRAMMGYGTYRRRMGPTFLRRLLIRKRGARAI